MGDRQFAIFPLRLEMMAVLADIFALACGVAGWFYLFYSKAAGKLAIVEPAAQNTVRVRLRRLCGVALVLLGIGFYAGFNAVDDRRNPAIYLAVWMVSILLLLLIIALVAADIHLTRMLRRKSQETSRNKP
jgi:hypothetical protein